MKKGFTLVELLAVIVILAVIALITIPAVMKMIDTSTINSYRRSIDLYGKAVSQGIISYESDMVEKGQKIDVSFQNIINYIEYEGNDVECGRKIIYSDKTILLTECSVDEELVYGEKGKGYGEDNYYYYTNSKKKMKLIEYIEAVEEAIQDKNVSGTCTIGEDKITCNGEDIKIRSKLENAIEGTITIETNKVKSYNNLKFETEKKVIKQEEIPEVVDEQITNNENNNQTSTAICKSKTGSVSTELGTEYECEVTDGTKFNFYVLSKEDNKINLIMDRNICEDGQPETAEKIFTVAWHSEENNNTYGPDTVMQVLYDATKYWEKIPNMNLEYDDAIDNIESGHTVGSNNGYTGMTIINGIGYITKKNGQKGMLIGNETYPLKARLPKYSEIYKIDSKHCAVFGSCPAWLVNNLTESSFFEVQEVYKANSKINGSWGYWLLTSNSVIINDAYTIHAHGIFGSGNTNFNRTYGIRPVITVSLSDLS